MIRHPVRAVHCPARRPAAAGFTLLEIMVVIFIIATILAIAVPNLIRARTNSQKTVCVSHLRQLQDAKERWAMEEKKRSNDVPVKVDLYPGYVKTWPSCPGGGEYTLNSVSEPVTCSKGGGHAIE